MPPGLVSLWIQGQCRDPHSTKQAFRLNKTRYMILHADFHKIPLQLTCKQCLTNFHVHFPCREIPKGFKPLFDKIIFVDDGDVCLAIFFVICIETGW